MFFFYFCFFCADDTPTYNNIMFRVMSGFIFTTDQSAISLLTKLSWNFRVKNSFNSAKDKTLYNPQCNSAKMNIYKAWVSLHPYKQTKILTLPWKNHAFKFVCLKIEEKAKFEPKMSFFRLSSVLKTFLPTVWFSLKSALPLFPHLRFSPKTYTHLTLRYSTPPPPHIFNFE